MGADQSRLCNRQRLKSILPAWREGRILRQSVDKSGDLVAIGRLITRHEKIMQRGAREALRIGQFDIDRALVSGRHHSCRAMHLNTLIVAIGRAARIGDRAMLGPRKAQAEGSA